MVHARIRPADVAPLVTSQTLEGVRAPQRAVRVTQALLAAVAQHLFIPHEGFEESLERSGGHVLVQRDRLDVLALPLGE